jgi:NTE family protein
MSAPARTTGLVLGGGGARAAYQVGVVAAIERIARESGAPTGNPFQVIAGTSAGAIIAAALASHADRWSEGIERLLATWTGFHAAQVFRSDAAGIAQTGAQWLSLFTAGWLLSGLRRTAPRSLLDNTPLEDLLRKSLPLARLPQVMAEGHLHGLAVCASSYSSGNHVTFIQSSRPIESVLRAHRRVVRANIEIEHLLASSAIPFAFPAVRLPMGSRHEWFGDGSMRQAAPISPAIHMGADRVLVVGAGRLQEPPAEAARDSDYPTLAQVAGHAMASIFLDSLALDVERAQGTNQTIALLEPEARARTHLRPIDVLVISPSERIDDIAARHLRALPTPVRAMLRAVGVGGTGRDARGTTLASYLLFEAPFTRDLIALGQADALSRREAIRSFFGWAETPRFRND